MGVDLPGRQFLSAIGSLKAGRDPIPLSPYVTFVRH